MVIHAAVIDFETANSRSNSACQLGVVRLEDWRIVEEKEWLIRPQRLYFSPQCVRVHGITARDCLASPEWDHVWDKLFPLIDGCVIVAHNVGFDAAVLQGTCQLYDIAVPQFDLQCTRLIAKRAWPGQSGYGLAAIAERLSIQFRHHNALEDARACAQIAIAAAEKSKAENLEDLEEKLGLTRGRIWVDQVRQPRTVRRTRIESVAEPQARYQPKLFRTDGTPSRSDQIRRTRLRADAILASCEDFRPLAGKHVVLMHTLLGLDREDSVSFLTKLGAVVQSKMNLQTHYLIMGTASSTEDENSESSLPIVQVEQRNKEGQPVKILTQRQLLGCIPSGLAIARGDW
jgi:DNA polymerase III subunit epsilon